MKFLPKIDVKIEKNLAPEICSLVSKLGFKNKKICFISDKNIWRNYSNFFDIKFLEQNCKILILNNPKADEKNLKSIDGFLKNKALDLIIAFGSGTINDLCKFTSFKTNIPYIIFASAPSMNGYLSRNASIAVRGHKKTFAATLPLAVYADLEILKSAPKSMIQAGIGDVLCFYSCWFDWLLSHLVLNTKFTIEPFKILQEKMQFFVKNYRKFKLNDDKFLINLIEILLLSGAGMTIAEGSYPASQSEHLIAHAFEMRYPKRAKKIFHGLQIAVTTLAVLKLQEKLLAANSLQLNKTKFPERKIEKFFGKKIAAECKKEYLAKTDFNIDEINKRLDNCWIKYRNELQKALLSKKIIKSILQHFQIKISAKHLGLSNSEFQALIKNAKFIRNRFTCLDAIM